MHDNSEEMDVEQTGGGRIIDDKHDIFGYVPKKYRNTPSGSEADENKDEESENSASSSDDERDGTNPYGEFYMIDKWIGRAHRHHKPEANEIVAQLREENEDLDDDDLRRIVVKKLLPKYRKHFRTIYQNHLLQMEGLKKNRVHKQIMETVRQLEKEQDMDRDEAIRKAVTERKHLIDRLVSSDEDGSSSDESSDEERDDEEDEVRGDNEQSD